MRRHALIGAAVLLLVHGAGTVTFAQPSGPPPDIGRLRVVHSEPAVTCQNQQDLRRFLTAFANGNRVRAHEVAQSCAILAAGTRVAIMERPSFLNVWQFQTRQTVTYRDVLVRVMTGPARGYVGYILLDAIG